MRNRAVRVAAATMIAALLMLLFVFSAAAAQTETYRIEEFGLSIKFPESDYVITRDTPRDDEAFEALGLDYDQTRTALTTNDIYLFAYNEDNTYQLSLTITQDENTIAVNNYSDITNEERQAIVEEVKKDESVESAAEVKHNGSLFIESDRSKEMDGKTVYIKLSNTIINGYQFDLAMQKDGEPISADEAKALTNAANSLKFDKINRNTGAVFSWWRVILWIGILALVAVAATILYKHRQKVNEQRMEERRKRHNATYPDEHTPAHAVKEEISFEESLGYQDAEEFADRADADLAEADEMATFEINVRERDPAKGISFFEDEGSGIDDGTDYFDTYFREPVERRAWYLRFFSAIGSYTKIAIKHTGYFLRNLFVKIGRWFQKLFTTIKNKIKK